MTTFILKNGNVKQADTAYLSYDRLKDTDGYYYFDSEILSVQNDFRKDICSCSYCGFTGTLEEMERHFFDEESKEMNCNDCYKKNVNTEIIEIKREKIENGYIETSKKKITYSSCNESCLKFVHRKHGYVKYDEKNTFFLAYPDGFKMEEKDIQKIIFDFEKNYSEWEDCAYRDKFGSYLLSYKNMRNLFVLKNARNTVVFQYDKKTENFIIYNEIFSDGRMIATKNLKERYSDNILKCNEQVKNFFKEKLR